MKLIFNRLLLNLSLLSFIACSDDNVNDFRPVPYPKEDPVTEPEEPEADEHIIYKGVFNAGDNNVNSFRIPTICVTNAGTLLVFCEARHKTWMDQGGKTDIAMKRSTDGGKNWSSMMNLTNESGNNRYMDPTVVVDRTTGKIFLFTSYWTGNEGINNKAILLTSENDGQSWSKKDVTADITIPEPRMIGSFGPGVGLQMVHSSYKNRLIIPVRLYKKSDNTTSNGGNTALYSDDNGATWNVGTPNKSGEWQIAEAPDGALIGNIRLPGGRQCHMSVNGGSNWTFFDYKTTDLPSPTKGCSGGVVSKDNAMYYSGPMGITAANGHDDRGRLYLTKATFMGSGNSHTWGPRTLLYENAAGYTSIAVMQDGQLAIITEAGDSPGFITSGGTRPAGWMRMDLHVLKNQ